MKVESQSAQLTIFYGGQVMVFDDFPAEKAKQVIDLANKGNANGFTAELNNNQSAYTKNIAKNQKEIASIPRPVPSPAKNPAQEPIQTNTSSLASGKFFSQATLFQSLAFWLIHICLTYLLTL